MLKKSSILWFRQDLRLHDNEALYEALKASDEIVPVYVFDVRKYEKLDNGIFKTAPLRARFIIESVLELRNSLQSLGSDLVVRVGIPEDEVARIASKIKTNWVFCNRERTPEELSEQDRLEESLWAIGQEIRFSRGKMLYYTQDLPFPITQTPDAFSGFRKEVERFVSVREVLDTPPERMPRLNPNVEIGEIPTLEDLGYDPSIEMSDVDRVGGEQKGIEQLDSFLMDLKSGTQKKMEISPWLSNGCLSPKYAFHKLDKIKIRTVQPLVKELKRNLMLRDFHRLMGKKYTHGIFRDSGLINDESGRGSSDMSLLRSWILGRTDNDMVNACMRELANSGFLAHQKRRLVAYYLIHVLNVTWLLGAQYFESILLDYDPCSNYGNWQRCAGLSLDQKGEIEVNFDTAQDRLDPDGNYLSEWLGQDVPSFLALESA